MKKFSEKFISKFLVLIMIISMLPVMAVSAEEYTYDENGFAIVDGVVVDYKGPGGDITIPAGVTKIATDSLTSVECTALRLPKGLKSIESRAINMPHGSKIYLPSDWEGGCEIPTYGFNNLDSDIYGCSIVVPADIKVIDTNFAVANKIIVTGAKDDSYKKASWYNTVNDHYRGATLPVVREEDFDKNGFVIKDGVLITYDGPGGDLVIPNTVKEIGELAFAGLDIFDSVTIPDSVTKANKMSFYGLKTRCKKFSTGNGLTELPVRFFSPAMACEELVLGENIEIVRKEALYGCYATEINIPESLKVVEEGAFGFFENIKSIDLSHVEEFGYQVFTFYDKKILDVIDLSSAKKIDSYALQRITADKLIIGADLEEIGYDSLPKVNEEIVWPENGKLRTLKEGAISNIEVLKNSPLPDYIEVIDDYAASGTAEVVKLPKNLKTLGKNALPMKSEGQIVLPSGWTGTSEINENAFMVSYGTKQNDFAVVIPTDVKGIEDSLINAKGVSTFVIQKLPGETSYKNKDWYKKLVDSGKEIIEEIDTDASIEFYRIENTNEYKVTIKSKRISEDTGNVDVVFDIPEGFSFVEGSYEGATGKLVSVKENKVTVSIPINKYNDISVKLVQDELFTEKNILRIFGTVNGYETVSRKATPVYVDFAINPYVNYVKFTANGLPNENAELYIDGVKNEIKFDKTGYYTKIQKVNNPTCEVYIKACGLESDHINVDVKVKDISDVSIERLEVTHKAMGNAEEITTDISKDGEVITCYPKNIFTFEIEGNNLHKLNGGLGVVCGESTLEVKKVDGKYIAQGYISKIKQEVEIKYLDETIFTTTVKWIVDPSGYVYEINSDNRVEGATATIYYSEYETGKNAVKWDAENYGQKNDLVTGEDGYFAWDVPEGYYQVVIDKKGYTTTKSSWLPVPPVQLDVNLAIKDLRMAKVKCVAMEEDHMNIYFDKYLNEYDAILADNYIISDGTNKINISKVTPIDVTKDDSRNYVKAVRIDFEAPLKGDQLNKLYKVSFARDRITTYSGTKCVFPAITGIKVEKEVTEIKTDKGTAVRLGNNIEITATLLPLDAVAGKKVKASVSDETVAKILSVSDVDANGNVKIVLEGEKYGQTDIKIEIENGAASATMPVFVAVDTEVKKEIQAAYGIASLPREKDKSGKIVLEDGETASEEEKKEDEEIVSPAETLKVGTVITVGKAKYVVGKNNTVTYKGATSKKVASVNIPDTIKIKGKTYKVTAISANAFKNNKKLKKVTIGKNVKTIGKSAFYGCKSLKTVIIKTTKLTSKSVGKNAFAKINSKAKVKVTKSKLKSYKKLLKSKGIKGKKQKVTK